MIHPPRFLAVGLATSQRTSVTSRLACFCALSPSVASLAHRTGAVRIFVEPRRSHTLSILHLEYI
jgi:hypothetical protein